MAEVKNAFIKSKMNQDLDGRLLPSGEYREGINIQVSKSEGPDVGALENVRGNQLIADFKTLTGIPDSSVESGIGPLDVIGQYTDVTNNIIYVFLTNYTDPTVPIRQTYSTNANNFIFSYNISTGDAIQLIGTAGSVSSSWLNFSKTNPIIGINVLENLLFWTDNRNQPRKLNISQAAFSATETTIAGIKVLQSNYYTLEEQISVAKLYPYECINLYRLNVATGKSNSVLTGTVINLLTSTIIGDIQPGAVVSSTNITASPVATVVSVSAPSGNPFVTAITISSSKTWGTGGISDVITFTPATSTYSTSMLDVVSQYLPNGGLGATNGSGTGTIVNILDSSVQGQITPGATVSSTNIVGSITVVSVGAPSGNPAVRAVTLSSSSSWTNNETITFNANPDYDVEYPGDPDYLRSKFARFSYRYKFTDGEYSPFAPFTQAVFIPQQDGYFLSGDEEDTFRSTVVNFMQNKVNKVILNIPLPSTNISTDYKIQEIDILYKESDGLAVTVLDTILNSSLPNNANFIDYQYQSRKPFKTLPESQLVRVYDKVPVKAFGQEISGNRVIYSNFQDKHTPPNQLDYNVGAFDKNVFDINDDNDTLSSTSITEYPMHTLKQNRNYQVGVVLSDKFGRSSTVILSSVNAGDVLDAGGNGSFGGATYYHPYKSTAAINSENEKISTWPGDSLKVLFNSIIPNAEPRNDLPGYPGLYNGNTDQPPANDGTGGYNPLGWYSYKIVVKQFEQEYYNVYLPGILNGYPGGTIPDGDVTGSTAFVTLINDNINKVPRDLSEVGPEQKQYRSSIQLYGRVTPDADAAIPTFNKQFYPGTNSNTVNTIGEQDFVLGTTADYNDIYQTISNPYLGRITQTPGNAIGSLPSTSTYSFFLGVYETQPVESRINIFWETSTTGLISDLNAAIEGGVTSVIGLYEFEYKGKESDAPGTYVTNPFAPEINGILSPPVPLNSNMTLASITQGASTIIPLTGPNAKFILEKFVAGSTLDPSLFPSFTETSLPYDSYALKTAPGQYFFFGDPDAIAAGQMDYEFVFNVENFTTKPQVNGTLENVSPVITNTECTTGLTIPEIGPENGVFITMTGNNGMPAGAVNDNQRNLTWSLDSSSASNFSIDPATGGITTSTIVSGPVNLTVVLTDAGGKQATCNLSPTFGELPINPGFGSRRAQSAFMAYDITQSTTIIWTDNATNSVPIPSANNFNTAPFSELEFTQDELPTSGNNYRLNKEKKFNVNGGNQTFINQVVNALGSSSLANKTQADGGLSAGTAFISIEATLVQSNAEGTFDDNDRAFFAMPIQLQYRGSNNVWVDAIDIEGNSCLFGGTNKNNYDVLYAGVSIEEQWDYVRQGVIQDPVKAEDFSTYTQDLISNSPSKANNETTTLQGDLEVKQTGSSAPLVTVARKAFAIGAAQSYESVSDKFGDYRLIVRYPYASEIIGINYNGVIVLGYSEQTGTITVPTAPWISGTASGLVSYNISWGDFYYPKPLNDQLNPIPNAIPTSFEYNITAAGKNDVLEASRQGFSLTTVFAREWDMKYVSQLYRDSQLTQKFIPLNYNSSNAWYALRPLSANTINAKFGTSNSNSGTFGINTQGFAPINGFYNVNRKWCVYLDQNGKKAVRDAEPVFHPGN